MVWDTIHGRDPAQAAVQEWGGISYALAALDATLPDDWEIVPLIKVGRDLAAKANDFLRSLRHTPHSARFLEVPELNNRVTLRYESVESGACQQRDRPRQMHQVTPAGKRVRVIPADLQYIDQPGADEKEKKEQPLCRQRSP